MGRKVHPTGFRLGVIQDWRAKWYAEKHYVQFLREDLEIRRAIRAKYVGAAISLVEIDRQGDKILVNIHTARPGVVIGRGGQRVDEMRQYLEGLIGSKVQLNIQEIRQPELDAYLVAEAVAEQISRRVAYRRAMKQAILRTLEAGARGMRISCAGRLAGAEIARREVSHRGQVPLHKLRADIDYGFTEAHTTLGRIGVKVWIYKGDILPEAKVEEVEAEMPTAVGEVEVPVETADTAEPEGVVEETAPVESAEVAPSVEMEAQPEAVSEAIEVAPAPEPEEAAALAATEAEEKPKPKARKKAEAEAPAAEAEEKPKPKARKKAVAEAPAAEAEEKPKPRARKKVEAEAPAAAETEEKPKPKVRKKAEAEAPAATEAEEKPKPRARKKAEAPAAEAEEKPKPKARKKAEAEMPSTVESGEQDATTETG